MSLTPAEIQARIDRAREIQSTFSPEKVVGAVTRLFDLVPAEEPDEYSFPAFSKPTRDRIFGGQVIAQALVAACVPLLGQCQAHGSKVVQLVKAGFAREAALAVDDAPALRPHLHSGQAVAQGAGVFKLRRNHLLRQ